MKERGGERLGYMSSWTYISDPKRLAFLLARYKFVAKMMDGLDDVLEVGCADAFGTRIVAQATGHVTAIDFDQDFVESALDAMSADWPITVLCHDMLDGPVSGEFDGAYSLDVLEHIPTQDERRFVANMTAPLRANGVAIIGSPSLESQHYASEPSREGHVNCKTQADLKSLMGEFFHNVFVFSMNDEVVHTGFHALSHYNLILCCGKR